MEMLIYRAEDINKVLAVLNALNVQGLSNMAAVVECSRILQNPVEVCSAGGQDNNADSPAAADNSKS